MTNQVQKIDQPEHADTSTSIIQVIERAAQNPQVDIDKMERLLEMQERIFERQALMSFNSAMAAAQAEMEPVARDAKNSHTRSNYARLEAIAKAITPVSARHGFAPSFGTATCDTPGYVRVTCELSHTDGHSKSYHLDLPVDGAGAKGNANKNATQAYGSTLTYGRRYLKLMMFDIATEDDDGNKSGGDTLTSDQVEKIKAALNDANATEDFISRFLNHMKAKCYQDIRQSEFDRALVAIKKSVARRANRDG